MGISSLPEAIHMNRIDYFADALCAHTSKGVDWMTQLTVVTLRKKGRIEGEKRGRGQ